MSADVTDDARDPEEVADEVFEAHVGPIGDDTDRPAEWSRDFYEAIASRATSAANALTHEMGDI